MKWIPDWQDGSMNIFFQWSLKVLQEKKSHGPQKTFFLIESNLKKQQKKIRPLKTANRTTVKETQECRRISLHFCTACHTKCMCQEKCCVCEVVTVAAVTVFLFSFLICLLNKLSPHIIFKICTKVLVLFSVLKKLRVRSLCELTISPCLRRLCARLAVQKCKKRAGR